MKKQVSAAYCGPSCSPSPSAQEQYYERTITLKQQQRPHPHHHHHHHHGAAVVLTQIYSVRQQLQRADQLALLFLSCVAAAAALLLLLLLFSSTSLKYTPPNVVSIHRHLAFSSSHHDILSHSQQSAAAATEHNPTMAAAALHDSPKEDMDTSAASVMKDEDIKYIPEAQNSSQTHAADSPLLGPKVTNWDAHRRAFLSQNPMLTARHGHPNILLVTGSRPKACENPFGDHSLLIFMKNKVDYCRLHGIQIFYNTAQFNSEMTEYWSKLPLLRTLMLSHPEMEWLWWMDSDAMITDMTFELPMEKYEKHNLIIPGNRDEVFIKRSWIGLNAGIFLIRNCQWSLDLIDTWALMGPKGSIGDEWGKILSKTLPDRPLFASDDQSSLIYLLLTQKEIWESKVVLESSYCLHGYWVGIVDRFEEMMESSHPGYGDDRWPFVTHFVGCKPCGRYATYEEERCLEQMQRAFNFADNQILQLYGFQHKHLKTGEVVRMENKTSTDGKTQ